MLRDLSTVESVARLSNRQLISRFMYGNTQERNHSNVIYVVKDSDRKLLLISI